MGFIPQRDYDIPEEKIEQLRIRIFEYARNNPEEIDIEDLRSRVLAPEDLANNNVDTNNNTVTNWMLKRYLIASHKDVDVALTKMVEFFRFRTEFRMSQLTLTNCLPTEFYSINPILKQGVDREGNSILLIRLKFYKKIPQFDRFIMRGILYYFEQIDKDYEQGRCDGLCAVLDCTNFSLTNVDLDLLQFIIKTVPFHYYGLVRNVLIYETPFLLKYIFKVVETWLPSVTDKATGKKRQMFHAVEKKTVEDYIEKSEIEAALSKKDEVIPKEAVPFMEMVKMVDGVKAENIDRINQHIQQLSTM